MPAVDPHNIRPLRAAFGQLASERTRAASESFAAACARLDTARTIERQTEGEVREAEQDDRRAALVAVEQGGEPPKPKAPRLRERHAQAARTAEAAQQLAATAQASYLAELRREAEGLRDRSLEREHEARQKALQALDRVDAELREAAAFAALAEACDASLMRGSLAGFNPELSPRQVEKRVAAVTGAARDSLEAQVKALGREQVEHAERAA